jgi:hypothetical protein
VWTLSLSSQGVHTAQLRSVLSQLATTQTAVVPPLPIAAAVAAAGRTKLVPMALDMTATLGALGSWRSEAAAAATAAAATIDGTTAAAVSSTSSSTSSSNSSSWRA